MSEHEASEEEPDGGSTPTLRRGLLGYKRADVDRALEARDGELDDLAGELEARDAELSELRQDVAALWLAFAQHDRMIREALQTQPAAEASAPSPGLAAQQPQQTAPQSPEPEEPVLVADPGASSLPPDEPVEGEPSVGRQLADLDDVLAAIELATQTLEQTYVEEIAEPREQEQQEQASATPQPEEPAAEPAAEAEPEPAPESGPEPARPEPEAD